MEAKNGKVFLITQDGKRVEMDFAAALMKLGKRTKKGAEAAKKLSMTFEYKFTKEEKMKIYLACHYPMMTAYHSVN